MAVKSPVTTTTTAGYVDPNRTVYGGVNAIAADLISNGTHYPGVAGMRFTRWYFSDMDDTDTWGPTSTPAPPPRPVAVAWQPDQADTDICAVTITTAGEAPVITIDCENANSKGWVWVLSYV